MLLYAGKASISSPARAQARAGSDPSPRRGASFKYSLFIYTVKKLKPWSQSAGNAFILKSGTSETIRDNTENIKKISIHVPTHLKPLNAEQFGHYLAGLIDGDGHFSSKQQLVIVFSSPDAQLAYYVKEIIGFGNVNKVKDKNAYLYIISNKDGIIKTINLINGKLRTFNKFNQVINNILAHPRYIEENIEFKINNSNDFNNHWIAGFSDADASFQIKVVNRDNKPRPEIRLNYQIDQKDNNVLLLIKEVFGGNIGYRKSQDSPCRFTYSSDSYGSARKIINYLDKYALLSSKHIQFLRWRKAYVLLQSKISLTPNEMLRIEKYAKHLQVNNSVLQVKHSFKSLIINSLNYQQRTFSTCFIRRKSVLTQTAAGLNPNWVSGFGDAESSFIISITAPPILDINQVYLFTLVLE